MNLYVGNLSYDVAQADLEELFGSVGVVSSVVVVRDKYSGESRGFGFVEMDSADDGKKAIEKLNGAELKGRTIVVNEARPRPQRSGGHRGGGRGGGGRSGGGSGSGGYRY